MFPLVDTLIKISLLCKISTWSGDEFGISFLLGSLSKKDVYKVAQSWNISL